MKTENFFAIISGLDTVVENTPDTTLYEYPESCPENFDFEDVIAAFWESKYQLVDALFRTMAFAFVLDRDGSFVKIFGTVEERDRFIAHAAEVEAKRKAEHPETVKPNADFEERIESGEVIVRAINYAQFMEYSQGSEQVYPYFAYDEVDNAIIFEHLGRIRLR